ncbi:MAG: hypothetical protein IAC23_00730 [Bacteroidetes bacterium]|uniref:Uncharacterized protein n=1 Tax=Candidatus Cryptobacteroides merdavium TaxID=2840769 RepID=A0A9D9EA96_9BACT|nr:hypothetical protein [Candidatus Cryptobacteroides merdavium]
MLKVSPYSCNIIEVHVLMSLDKIEVFCMKNGISDLAPELAAAKAECLIHGL